MLELRRDAERIIARVQKGQPVILTRRGKPVARLVPIRTEPAGPDDTFYALSDLAAAGGSLDNSQIDQIVYGR